MELENMLTLIKAVSDSELTHFSLETEEMKLTLEKKREQASTSSVKTEVKEVVQNQERKEELKIEEKEQTEDNEKQQSKGPVKPLISIKSPLVGIFYRASSPEKEPFVKVGDSVKKGQVLGLIEAMKLMNEIEAEKDGIVEAILVENEQMVEYGQVLFRIL